MLGGHSLGQDHCMAGSGTGGEVSLALARVLPAIGGAEVVERLAALSGSDFTSVMLAVARQRAARETPASVLRRYRSDRFVQPAAVQSAGVESAGVQSAGLQSAGLRRAEDMLAASLPPAFEMLTLSPLAPIGTHAVLGPLSQDKVVTALRASEVAADPTNGLALEAAVRRIRVRDAQVRLAAFQRVVRAEPARPGYFAHFSLLGLVTAGRDDGGHRFEREAVAEHARALAAGLLAAGLLTAGQTAARFSRIQLALTPLTSAGEAVASAVSASLADAQLDVVVDENRQAGRGYYRELCFKINVMVGAELTEVGDGGFTDWTARLTASGKERLLISGIGIDRVAALMGQ
jgi:hypothetical protein